MFFPKRKRKKYYGLHPQSFFYRYTGGIGVVKYGIKLQELHEAERVIKFLSKILALVAFDVITAFLFLGALKLHCAVNICTLKFIGGFHAAYVKKFI